MMQPRSSRAFRLVFALLAVLTCLPIWTVDFLPMVDLPQHAAQVSILRHWHDADCGYAQLYEIHWFTPYWLGYLLAYALSWLVPVATSFRILLCLALVGTPWIVRLLVRDLGGDEWWSLLCFPLGFGTTLSWGFFNFVVAIPLTLLVLREGFRYSRHGSWRLGLRLGLLCASLVLAHVLALVFAGLLVGAVAAAESPSLRALPRRLAPLLLALPLPLAWALRTAQRVESVHDATVGGWDFERFGKLPALWTGMPYAPAALAFGSAVLLSVLLTRPTLGRRLARWLPFAITAGCIVFVPFYSFGTGLIYPRFLSFFLPTLLCALQVSSERPVARWRHVQAALLAGVMLWVVQGRYAGMGREAAALAELLAETPTGERLLYLDYDAWSSYSPEPVFLHFGAWYQVDRCGVAEPSFAMNFPNPVRFAAARASTLPAGVDLVPERFVWETHSPSFDLCLVRSPQEVPVERFAGPHGRVELAAHRGRWWLYRHARPVAALDTNAAVTRPPPQDAQDRRARQRGG